MCLFLGIITSYIWIKKIVHCTVTICLLNKNNDTQFSTILKNSLKTFFLSEIIIKSFVICFSFYILGNGSVPPTILLMLINEHLVKDEIALNFLLEVCSTLKQEKGLQSLVQALKKGNIESR